MTFSAINQNNNTVVNNVIELLQNINTLCLSES